MVDDTTVTGPVAVNVDALWLLQALLGVGRLAPELRARPYGSARTDEWLEQHPGVDSLREAGLVDVDGAVVPDVANRLAVLTAPDVEVVMVVSRGPVAWEPENVADPTTWRAVPGDQLRIVLARRDGRWVSAARAGEDITIDTVPPEPGVGDPPWLAATLIALLDSAHLSEPSRITPVNVPADQLISVAAARSQGAVVGPGGLRDLGLRGPALTELAEAIDNPAAEAVLYARVYDDTETRSAKGALDIRATDAGRVAIYRLAAVRGSDQEWMTIAPATLAQTEAGIKAVLSSLNIRNWAEHTRF